MPQTIPPPGALSPLPRSFFDRPALEVAPELLGCLLVRRWRGAFRACRLVETEAYLGPHDAASHSRMGRTARNAPMFGQPGRAYVYFIYGMHRCANAVCGPGRFPSAVLLRAGEPLAPDEATALGLSPLLHSSTGPGNLCKSLAVGLAQNRADLCSPASGLFLAAPLGARPQVVRGPRVGVDYAGAWAREPLRFCAKGSLHVSRPRPG
jgi:DNA-3-methyladenine glycosylase